MAHATAAARPSARAARRRTSVPVGRPIFLALLGLAALATLVPFAWEFVLATHSTSDIASSTPPFAIGGDLAQNYRSLMEYAPYFWRSMLNSAVIALGSTVTTLFFSALSGYAFARYDFPAK